MWTVHDSCKMCGSPIWVDVEVDYIVPKRLIACSPLDEATRHTCECRNKEIKYIVYKSTRYTKPLSERMKARSDFEVGCHFEIGGESAMVKEGRRIHRMIWSEERDGVPEWAKHDDSDL